jgi:hypothetical protein
MYARAATAPSCSGFTTGQIRAIIGHAHPHPPPLPRTPRLLGTRRRATVQCIEDSRLGFSVILRFSAEKNPTRKKIVRINTRAVGPLTDRK